jgi:hypothetical protein
VVNGTFNERAGTEVGAPIHVEEDGVLDVQGPGASDFEFSGGSINGNTTRSLGVGPHDIVAIYTGDRHSLASTSKDYTQQVAADATSVHPQTGPETPFGTLTTLRAVAHPGRLRPPITNRRRGFPGPGWRPAPRCCPRLYRRGRHPGRPEDHRFVALGR